MFRALFRNVAISAAAFLVVSVLGLLIVPVLISTYGLAGFGHITMARLFLPVTALGFLDFGFSEIATQAAARARVDGNWRRAGGLLWKNGKVAAGTGLAAAAALAAAAPWLPLWMGLPPPSHEGMTLVLFATAAMLPLLYLSLLLEGVVRGFERFGALRAIEVGAALSYAGLALWAAWGGFDENAVCMALLVSQGLRTALAGAVAGMTLRGKGLARDALSVEDRDWFWSRCRAMAANKSLGTAQTQLAPVLIGLLLGPTALGVYDALGRLPRAIKSVLGLLSSTVLPLAARLESAADDQGLKRLGETGLLLVGMASLPPLAASMVFSRPILELWLGPSLVPLWGWQAALFLIPAMSVLVGFGGAALLVRPHAVRAMNWLIATQLALQFVIALACMPVLQERAFFLGQLLAMGVTFVAQMQLIRKELQMPMKNSSRLLVLLAVIMALALPALFWASSINSWSALAFAMTAWTALCWAVSLQTVLGQEQRRRLLKALKERLGLA